MPRVFMKSAEDARQRENESFAQFRSGVNRLSGHGYLAYLLALDRLIERHAEHVVQGFQVVFVFPAQLRFFCGEPSTPILLDRRAAGRGGAAIVNHKRLRRARTGSIPKKSQSTTLLLVE